MLLLSLFDDFSGKFAEKLCLPAVAPFLLQGQGILVKFSGFGIFIVFGKLCVEKWHIVYSIFKVMQLSLMQLRAVFNSGGHDTQTYDFSVPLSGNCSQFL